MSHLILPRGKPGRGKANGYNVIDAAEKKRIHEHNVALGFVWLNIIGRFVAPDEIKYERGKHIRVGETRFMKKS